MLEGHKLTRPDLTGEWEKQLLDIERGSGDRTSFMAQIAGFTAETVERIAALDREKLRPERVELGPCPRCGDQTGEIIRENSPRVWVHELEEPRGDRLRVRDLEEAHGAHVDA